LINSALKGSIEFDVFYRNLISHSAQIKDKNPSPSADTILNIMLVCSVLFFIFTILLAAG
ncbi:MAG: hypothetical protein PWQ60_1640, partial [Thermoanaerobacteraceae bacterium]|nr:hypothetical protein [Thermoanaerobacteraceae bacterium]